MIYQENHNKKKLNKEKYMEIKIGVQFFSESKDKDLDSFFKNYNSESESDNDAVSNDNFKDISSNNFQKSKFDDLSLSSSEDSDDEPEINFETGEAIEDSSDDSNKRTLLASIFDLLEVFSYAVALMVIVFLFVVKFVTVDGNSMNYTLMNEDRLIIYNLFYTPKVNDVIVINLEERNELLVKRVIGVEGDTVKIDFDTWEIWVNDSLLDQSYLDGNLEIGKKPMEKGNLVGVDSDNCISFVVEEGKVFVLGDNRNHSSDSRVFGQMDMDEIMGKVVFRVFPFESIGTVK